MIGALLAAALLLSPLPAGGAPARPTIRVAAGGDVVFGRIVDGALRRVGGDDPFAAAAATFSRADLAFVNLETPLCDGSCGGSTGEVRFRAHTAYAAVLARAGIDVVALANNHALDGGRAGLQTTLASLSAAGVRTVGASLADDPFAPVFFDLADARVAVFAATDRRRRSDPPPQPGQPVARTRPGTLGPALAGRIERLREARAADVVVVSIHWGLEGRDRPTRAQVATAHALVDAGAHLVLGHHPHVLQPVEVYGDAFVIYSMGNLIFDDLTLPARDTGVFTMTVEQAAPGRWRAAELRFQPLRATRRDLGPQPLPREEAQAVCAALAEVSRLRFGTVFEEADGGLVLCR